MEKRLLRLELDEKLLLLKKNIHCHAKQVAVLIQEISCIVVQGGRVMCVVLEIINDAFSIKK
ncbi:hypothetical protein NSA18_04780 [Pasteurella caecimuris]|uniref:hypothetical protein n=1 Tax=Rodentibacter caecimuris TaxID=1796644 RepID=UPI00215043AD|nr:hypothetical protein [Pasteurella caecimuris]MCR1837223.1 hypothetical protein [Pasteurella caecimuris]MCU0106274.1 hypothetical protein [Pasteurella caecimuris]